MPEPRRFGLTERQFVLVLSLLGLTVLAIFTCWARSSDTGFLVFFVVIGAALIVVLAHRLVAGHWIDGSR